MERESYGAGDLPHDQGGDAEERPQGDRADGRLGAIGINPGHDLRQQRDRCETAINDEQQVPGHSLLRNGIPYARTERRHTVQDYVAGYGDRVNYEKSSPRRGFDIAQA